MSSHNRRIELNTLRSETRFALRALQSELAQEPHFLHVQVTFDSVRDPESSPTVDVIRDE